MNTGLRRGEVFNVQWTDINFQTKTLTVRGEGAKSGETRHIPLNPEAVDALKQWKRQSGESAQVFPGRLRERLDNIKTSWRALMTAAKIKDFRFHDLRHSFASKLVMRGVPLNTIRELLGHADLTTTLRYAHLAPDHKAEAVAMLTTPRLQQIQ
jgi:integrase